VENEGNGRMCTTVPPLHIALMGIEKLIENVEDIPAIYRLLCGSATGQRITTYFNMISGPRKTGERDGPKEVHLVLLDNGRSKIMNDPQLGDVLKCIRCGTCLNHCPVFTRIGGHAYGSTYPGPIGEILVPQIEGLNPKGAIATASSLCDACAEACPVRIPIPELIRRMRDESYGNADPSKVALSGYKRSCVESMVWKGWKWSQTCPTMNKMMLKGLALFGKWIPVVGPLRAWMSVRSKPQFGKNSLKDLAKKEGLRHE
jgi:L-lactate dehydrogenase complex protein LldF